MSAHCHRHRLVRVAAAKGCLAAVVVAVAAGGEADWLEVREERAPIAAVQPPEGLERHLAGTQARYRDLRSAIDLLQSDGGRMSSPSARWDLLRRHLP